MTPVIAAEALGKRYRYYGSRRGRLVEWMTLGRVARHEGRWALRDLTFSIAAGESVGIIGHNGAGKSTLLKLLTGTTRPTAGRCGVRGRVAALLELGIGFHPDFTGRENVATAGRLLGLGDAEVARRMDDIVAFADLASHIDQPLRTYSSGMQMRLAFSLATAIRPEVLIVDEALAVGDIFFQQKCFDRIRSFQAAGTTLLLVSHDLGAVYNLCHRVLLLEHGQLLFDGPPKDGIELYYSSMLRTSLGAVERPPASESANGTQSLPPIDDEADEFPVREGDLTTAACRLLQVRLFDEAGNAVQMLVNNTSLSLAITLRFFEELDDPHVGFKIHDRTGTVIFETTSYGMRRRIGHVGPGELVRAIFAFPCRLAPGQYTITIGVGDSGYNLGDFRRMLAYLSHARAFSVARHVEDIVWSGVVNLVPELSVQREHHA